jgi:hypothetical protein
MTTHRADYIFDHGMWIGKCRICDFAASDPIRRRAADQFRLHIKEMLELDATRELEPVIDVDELAGVAPAGSASDLA